MRLFDITRPIYGGMDVYDGDPRVVVRRVASVVDGAVANISEMCVGTHTGTHVDAPLHFREGGPGVDEIPLDILIGPARVHELVAVREGIDAVALRGLDLGACPRVLFKTRGAEGRDGRRFWAASAGLTAEAARALVDAGVRLVGVDGASIDPPGAVDFAAHRMLLDAGVIVLEGLDLSAVPPGTYELLCLPLKLLGGDGAPARVALRSL